MIIGFSTGMGYSIPPKKPTTPSALQAYLDSIIDPDKKKRHTEFYRKLGKIYGQPAYFPDIPTQPFFTALEAFIDKSKIQGKVFSHTYTHVFKRHTSFEVTRTSAMLKKGDTLDTKKAYDLAFEIYLNPLAHKDGVTLLGSDADKALLQGALDAVQALNPGSNKIKIHNPVHSPVSFTPKASVTISKDILNNAADHIVNKRNASREGLCAALKKNKPTVTDEEIDAVLQKLEDAGYIGPEQPDKKRKILVSRPAPAASADKPETPPVPEPETIAPATDPVATPASDAKAEIPSPGPDAPPVSVVQTAIISAPQTITPAAETPARLPELKASFIVTDPIKPTPETIAASRESVLAATIEPVTSMPEEAPRMSGDDCSFRYESASGHDAHTDTLNIPHARPAQQSSHSNGFTVEQRKAAIDYMKNTGDITQRGLERLKGVGRIGARALMKAFEAEGIVSTLSGRVGEKRTLNLSIDFSDSVRGNGQWPKGVSIIRMPRTLTGQDRVSGGESFSP